MLYMEKNNFKNKRENHLWAERFSFFNFGFFFLLLNDSNVTHGVYFKTDILKERFVLFEP